MAYRNGFWPESALIIFNRGTTVHPGGAVEKWYWGLTPGTYQKHLALVALAKRNTGRNLQPSAGFSCYRPYAAQVFARKLYGNGAAQPGTSSHGGFWEGQETLAIDYHNWASVYDGNRARWYADVRAVGLEPGLISPQRGYPDEPWHVIDKEPRRAVPAGGGAQPFPGTETPTNQEDEMRTIHSPNRPWANIGAGYVRNITDEAAANTIWPKHELNDRQYDLAVEAAFAPVLTSPVGGMLVVSSPNRPKTVLGAGYYRVLNDEEAGNVAVLADRVVLGNDRQYDLWVSIALSGQGAAFPVAVPDSVDEVIAGVLAGLPAGTKAPTLEEIAVAVREQFREDPLK
jgi:hypothetical protein